MTLYFDFVSVADGRDVDPASTPLAVLDESSCGRAVDLSFDERSPEPVVRLPLMSSPALCAPVPLVPWPPDDPSMF